MENASKALIIAGAILLAILLVSLGIMVYNNAKETASGGNLDTEEAQAFNTRISQYCGTRKSATDMTSLVDAIAASNGAQTRVATAERHVVNVEITGTSAYISGNSTALNAATLNSASTPYPTFSNGTTFTATYQTGSDGYINQVTISDEGGTATP